MASQRVQATAKRHCAVPSDVLLELPGCKRRHGGSEQAQQSNSGDDGTSHTQKLSGASCTQNKFLQPRHAGSRDVDYLISGLINKVAVTSDLEDMSR